MSEHIQKLKNAHKVIKEFDFEVVEIKQGYANRTLRIDLDTNEITIHPVTDQMKDLWTGGKGFDLWLMLQEIDKNTTWDSPKNPLCFASGPLCGTTSFPGSGKTIVTSLSPATKNIMDSNVGGYFGPYFKFAGFDALVIVGKAKEDSIIYIDVPRGKITIETSPLEQIDSHIAAEEYTEMYADDELDMRNIAVVSSGSGAEHTYMGLLNFSFYDWRRKVARLKQAGRGGIGTVFRHKKLKAMVIKNRGITPAWRIEENIVAKNVTPKTISRQNCKNEMGEIENIIKKYGNNKNYALEIMQDIQKKFRHISKTALEIMTRELNIPQAYLYHMATFYKTFTLEQLGETTVSVCMGAGCHAKGAQTVLDSFERVLNIKAGETTPDKKYTLEAASCLGACEIAPVVKVGDNLIGNVKPQNVEKILKEKGSNGERKTTPINLHKLDRPNISRESDQKYSTYQRLKKENNPDAIINTLIDSKLSGRGGGFFLTGEKWKAAKENMNEESECYLVCNSAIFELDPHLVIEGMLIGSLATGAKKGFISFRNEHSSECERYKKAIEQAYKKKIFGEGFDLETRLGAGGFLIGESSALLNTLQGSVGEAKPKYVHATESGFNKSPTVVNNIETWASISYVMEQGQLDSKLVSISGDIKKTQNLELPLETTLRDIVDTSGGVPKKRELKAVQIGGPSGGFIPESKLDIKLDPKALSEIGSMIGSSMITVKNDHRCMVDAAKYSVEYLLDESCGKCTPCREGLYHLSNIYKRICSGEGSKDDLEAIEEIANTLKESSLCSLGKTAANPILTTLENFKEEYEEHINEKKCRSGTCKDLVTFVINDNCTGCTICGKNCPVSCISGNKKEMHSIKQDECIRCGVCFDSCTFNAINAEVRK